MISSIQSDISSFIVLYGHPRRIIQRLFENICRFGFRAIQYFSQTPENKPNIHLIIPRSSQEDRDEILRRLSYYQLSSRVLERPEPGPVPLSVIISADPLLFFGPRSKLLDWLVTIRPGTFDVDFHQNPMDGWAWTGLAAYLDDERVDLAASRRRLSLRINELMGEQRQRCYIFGTGPSLEKAIDMQWENGYRIVCNTIVRDQELWEHLRPDFIVAGDAIYHFGFTAFARAFRRDLRERLLRSDTLFVYPAPFHSIVRQEFEGLEEHLIPIPTGWRRRIDVDLLRSFQLPNLGNVLGLLLLPLACMLSRQVYLWGFDGRAPDDKLFWSNSPKHSYPEYVDELKRAHPRFFEHHIPASDPNKYVRTVQGDQLDRCMQAAEKRGFNFIMMHQSWTPTLQKRHYGEN